MIGCVYEDRIESLVLPRRELLAPAHDLWACDGGPNHAAHAVERAPLAAFRVLMRLRDPLLEGCQKRTVNEIERTLVQARY